MRAAFLDRDGTIIEDVGYIRDPEQVELLPGVGLAIGRLNQIDDLVVIVVTNQSGIARGWLTLEQYRSIESRVDDLLAFEHAGIDAHYFCPHFPDLTGPCECRKPGTLLYRQAAERFGLDLSQSWWVGDRLRDVLPAEVFGGRGILVGNTEAETAEHRRFLRAPDLMGAVKLIDPDPGPITFPRAMTLRIAVAVSGHGSNLEALHRALERNRAAEIVLVLSDRADAPALDRARGWGVPAVILNQPRAAEQWLEQLRSHHVDLLVLAGYLRLVPAAVIAAYRGRIINVHPALLPAFGGKGMYGRKVHEAVLASGVKESGATVHLVDEIYDHGAVLAQARVPVLPDDTPDSLARRVLEVEHRLLPAVVIGLAEERSGVGSQGSGEMQESGDGEQQ